MSHYYTLKVILLGCILYSVSGQILNKLFESSESELNHLCGESNPNGLESNAKVTEDRSKVGQYPWTIALLNKGIFIGGGSLISPDVVLTAAHLVVNKNVADISVRAGEWNMASVTEEFGHEDRQVDNITVHEEFSFQSGSNNIALLFLKTPFKLKSNIRTICLPCRETSFDQKRCFVTGWGKLAFEDKNFLNIPKKIDLPLVSKEACQDMLRKTTLGAQYELHSSLMCAGGEKGKDACLGDGGSALFCPMESDPQRYEQIGIVNWGIGCGEENVPATYTNVEMFRDWIDRQLARDMIGVPLAAKIPLQFKRENPIV
ncbi:phenoloxidase-activating factor 2 [Drosophila eugracilis]|uniref:phenoloxidase-activating factor 2 n=1 Tax=Drosophila eugracilis TaxID=29029 RepID=UPI0007E79927|nr:phenoloxidase-activating factor 2 [Drosophila eugracilis]